MQHHYLSKVMDNKSFQRDKNLVNMSLQEISRGNLKRKTATLYRILNLQEKCQLNEIKYFIFLILNFFKR